MLILQLACTKASQDQDNTAKLPQTEPPVAAGAILQAGQAVPAAGAQTPASPSTGETLSATVTPAAVSEETAAVIPPPIAMQAATSPEPDRLPRGSPVTEVSGSIKTNLTGSDRYLVYRPLDRLSASDYSIGKLAETGSLSESTRKILAQIQSALLAKEKPEGLNKESALLYGILYEPLLATADTPSECRVGLGRPTASGHLEVAMRLISDTWRADGMLMLDQTQAPPTIVHFAINSQAILEPYVFEDNFDPQARVELP